MIHLWGKQATCRGQRSDVITMASCDRWLMLMMIMMLLLVLCVTGHIRQRWSCRPTWRESESIKVQKGFNFCVYYLQRSLFVSASHVVLSAWFPWLLTMLFCWFLKDYTFQKKKKTILPFPLVNKGCFFFFLIKESLNNLCILTVHFSFSLASLRSIFDADFFGPSVKLYEKHNLLAHLTA